MPWQTFSARCDRFPAPIGFREIYLTRPDGTALGGRWLVGPYTTLDRLATALRTNQHLRDLLSEFHVRFGERLADVAPHGPRQARIGPRGAPVLSDHTAERRTNINPRASASRVTDQFANVASYWATQRLQAHHIVEKSNLKALGIKASLGDILHDDVAPSVLLAAEFHQRLFTAEMAAQRAQFHSGLTRQQISSTLTEVYHWLYARPVTHELRWVADRIIEECARRK
jgi:hypothetical protein